MRKVVITIFLLIGMVRLDAYGQRIDSTFSLNQYFDLIQNHHPIARQALLIVKRGKLSVTQARGAFDPKLVSDYNTKDFDGKDYYQIWNSYVKVPTLLNVDLKAGYERNTGIFLNPENNVPSDGLYYAGISVPLGQGLIHNQRNIGVKKGKIERKSLENESRAVLNNLMLDALYVYWNWYDKYQKLQLVLSNRDLIDERYQGVRANVLNGENAAIDSVEMLIQVQQWYNMAIKAQMEFDNSLLLMNNYVWSDSVSLDDKVPETTSRESLASLDQLIEKAVVVHPELRDYQLSLSALELDRKLSAEQLKPVLNFNYNFLITDQRKSNDYTFFENNYKAGVQFSYPLLTRKERSKLKTVKIKQEETNYKLDQKTQEVITKIEASLNKVNSLRLIIDQQNAMIDNYETMVRSEQIKFDSGESSLFVLNSRQNKKIKAEMKLIESKAAYARAIANLQWASGIIAQETLGIDFVETK